MEQQQLDEILSKRQVARGLFLIRLADIDPDSRFHQDLLYSLEACPPEAPDGDLVTAMRFVVGQAKHDAATEHIAAKNAAKRMLRVDARQYRLEAKVSQAAAERMVEEESDEYWDLKVRSELAEVRAQYLTDLLYALQAALDTWRTTRADERAADKWHSQTAT